MAASITYHKYCVLLVAGPCHARCTRVRRTGHAHTHTLRATRAGGTHDACNTEETAVSDIATAVVSGGAASKRERKTDTPRDGCRPFSAFASLAFRHCIHAARCHGGAPRASHTQWQRAGALVLHLAMSCAPRISLCLRCSATPPPKMPPQTRRAGCKRATGATRISLPPATGSTDHGAATHATKRP